MQKYFRFALTGKKKGIHRAVAGLIKVGRFDLAGALTIFGIQTTPNGSTQKRQLLNALQYIQGELGEFSPAKFPLNYELAEPYDTELGQERLVTLAAQCLTNLDNEADMFLVHASQFQSANSATLKKFAEISHASDFVTQGFVRPLNDNQALLLSGIVGQINFQTCKYILQKAVASIPVGGIIAFDAQALDRLKAVDFDKILHPGSFSEADCLISSRAIEAIFARSFELVTFENSGVKTLPDLYIFRRIIPQETLPPFWELEYLINDLEILCSDNNGTTCTEFEDYYHNLIINGSKPRGKALNFFWAHQQNTNRDVQVDSVPKYSRILTTLRGETKICKNLISPLLDTHAKTDLFQIFVEKGDLVSDPWVVLICPKPDLVQFVLSNLEPSAICIYGLDKNLTNMHILSDSRIVVHSHKWEDIRDEPDSSVDFVFSSCSDMNFSRADSFLLLREIARIRKNSGIALLEVKKENRLAPFLQGSKLSEDCLKQTIHWAKVGNAKITHEVVSIDGLQYMCVRENKQYYHEIRRDIIEGELDQALQSFEKILLLQQLSETEAARIVTLFKDHDEFLKVVILFTVHFDTQAAVHHIISRGSGLPTDTIDIVNALTELANEEWAKTEVIYDLIGEFYRACGDLSAAQKFWRTALDLAPASADEKEYIDVLERKCNLLQACRIHRGTGKIAYSSNIEQPTKPKEPVILVESGMVSSAIDTLTEMYGAKKVYSQNVQISEAYDDQQKHGSLIGLVPEHSKLNANTHKYANKIARRVIKSLVAQADSTFGLWLNENRDVVELTIEDFLARHILILEAFAAAANNDSGNNVLLVGSKLGYFDTSLSVLLSRLDTEQIWLCADQPTSKMECYRHLFEASVQVKSDNFAQLKTSTRVVTNWYNKTIEHYEKSLSAYFGALDIRAGNSHLILANLSHRYYGESALAIAGGLVQFGNVPTVINTSIGETSSAEITKLWNSCHHFENIADQVSVLSMDRQKTISGSLPNNEGLKTWIYECVAKLDIDYHGISATTAFAHLISRTLSRDLPHLLFNSLYAEKILEQARPHKLIALSTRESRERIFAENAKRKKVPVIEVQTVDILRHPRYKKPIADHFTVIDAAAASTFEDYFGVSRDKITITGSPRSAVMTHPDRVKTHRDRLDYQGLAPRPAIRILFTTRTGEFELNLETLRTIASVCAKSRGVQLIVKTHPREELMRRAAYANILEKTGTGDAHHILSEGSAETFIQLSDCLISFPSNVVRDALASEKTTLLYTPSGMTENDVPTETSSQLLRAFTRAELKSRVSELIENFHENDHSNIGNKDESTIDHIVKVVKEVGAIQFSENAITQNKIAASADYSLLNLVEIFAAIRSFESVDEKQGEIIPLLGRAVDLARTSNDLQRVLTFFDSHAPGSLESAFLFANLARQARGDEIFHQTISELKSKKLAGFAKQLTQSHAGQGPFVALAMAHACLAVGDLSGGNRWLDSAAVKGNAPVIAAKAATEKSSLKLCKWNGNSETDDISGLNGLKRLIIIAERGSNPQLARQMLPANAQVDIYQEGMAGETNRTGAGISKIITSQDVLNDFAPEIQGIVNTANSFAQSAVGKVLRGLKDSQHIGWLRQIGDALQLELRAGGITPLRRRAALVNAIKGDYEAVVYCCASPAFFTLFSDIVSGTNKHVYVVGTATVPKLRAAFGRARRLGWDSTVKKQKDSLKLQNSLESTAELKEFDLRLNNITPRISSRPAKRAVIAVTRWRIGTIKDGLLTLLEQFPNDIEFDVFDTSRDVASATRFLSDIHDFSARTTREIRPYSSQRYNAIDPNFQTLKNNDLTKSIFASIAITKEWKSLPHAAKLASRNQIGILLHKTIPMLFNLHVQISACCENSSTSSLIVLPGRDSESITAQNAVGRYGLKTIDIQTAYFARGHTYTGPRGDFVTAIDEWSREVFKNWLGVPEDRIRIVGTSRFDRFAQLRMAHKDEQSVQSERPHICLAAQPVQFEATERILKCLDDLFKGGLDMDCTVKLHPRQPESIISNIEHIAHNMNVEDRLTVTRDSDLAKILLKSDVVVTMFSNVALEAALLDRPVLLANFSGDELPIPFDEFGVAQVAHSEAEFSALLKKMLFDTGYQEELKTSRQRYFAQHTKQWMGEAGKETAELIVGQMQKPNVVADKLEN